jgi:fructokinase
MRIGVDVGGTKISAVLFDKKVKKKITVPTPKTKTKFISELKNIIKQLDNGKVEHIGVGVPSITDGKKALNANNLPAINNVDLAKALGRKVKVLNDADAFALAEAKAGAAKGKKNVVGLITGTGIGSGIVINGQPYTGRDGQAGEGGMIWTSPFSGKEFESQWAGPGLERMYEELTGKKAKLENIAKMKSKEAKAVINYAIQGIAYICSIYANILNPDIIVLGGGVSNLSIYPQINKELKKMCHVKPPKVVKNKLGADAGVIGAAFA